MIGTYYIYDGDELVYTSQNIITTKGQAAILRFLAGERVSLGDYMVFGVGESTPTVSDTLLEFEYHRDVIDLKQSQLTESKIILRGTIPDQKEFSVYEIGVLLDEDTADTGVPSSLVTTFDGLDEGDWTLFDGTSYLVEGFEYAGGRTGTTSFQLDIPSSSTWSLIRDGGFGAFGDLRADDVFALAYETLSGSADNIEVRFRVDESNYRSYSFAPATGFNVHRWEKGNFVQVGDADWDSFDSLEVVVTSSGSGANVIFEGLRYDTPTSDEGETLVSRTVLPDPVNKRSTSELQIEYVLNIGFSVNGA